MPAHRLSCAKLQIIPLRTNKVLHFRGWGAEEVFLLEVKEVKEVIEVKAVCFEESGVKNSEVKPYALLIIGGRASRSTTQSKSAN